MTAETLILTISAPPSTNRLWRNVPGKGRVKTKEYLAWRSAAGWEIRALMVGKLPIASRYNLRMLVPISRRDTDNWIKPIGDLLQWCGVVTNDGNVHGIICEPANRTDCLIELEPLPHMDGVRSAPTPRKSGR